jgi:hypothetical protein
MGGGGGKGGRRNFSLATDEHGFTRIRAKEESVRGRRGRVGNRGGRRRRVGRPAAQYRGEFIEKTGACAYIDRKSTSLVTLVEERTPGFFGITCSSARFSYPRDGYVLLR